MRNDFALQGRQPLHVEVSQVAYPSHLNLLLIPGDPHISLCL